MIARDVVEALSPALSGVERSSGAAIRDHDRPRCAAAQRRASVRGGGAGRGLGGREGRRLRPRRADAGRSALGGATALCVATVAEGEELRTAADAHPGREPARRGEESCALDARLEVAVSAPPVPTGLDVHFKIDTGMGGGDESRRRARAPSRAPRRPDEPPRHGGRGGRILRPGPDPQVRRGTTCVSGRSGAPGEQCGGPALPRGPPGCGPLRHRRLRPLALRGRPGATGSSPPSWRSQVALTRSLAPGESTGYGRRFVAEEPMRVGIVLVGYADGSRRGRPARRCLSAASAAACSGRSRWTPSPSSSRTSRSARR